MAEKVFTTLLQDLVAAGELEVSRDKVKLASHTVTLSPARQVAIVALESTFREAAYQPPGADEALEAHKLTQADDRELLQVLVDQQKLVRLKGDIFYHRDVFADIERQLRKEMADHPQLPFSLLTLHYGQHRCRAMLDWCDESLRALARLGAQRGRARRRRGAAMTGGGRTWTPR